MGVRQEKGSEVVGGRCGRRVRSGVIEKIKVLRSLRQVSGLRHEAGRLGQGGGTAHQLIDR